MQKTLLNPSTIAKRVFGLVDAQGEVEHARFYAEMPNERSVDIDEVLHLLCRGQSLETTAPRTYRRGPYRSNALAALDAALTPALQAPRTPVEEKPR